MGMHIQFRLFAVGFDSEVPEVGEPFWDPRRNCLGVYAVPDNKIRWYPEMTEGFLTLKSNQRLGGLLASNNNANDLAFDFSVKDTIRIISSYDQSVVVSFAKSGSSFVGETELETASVGGEELSGSATEVGGADDFGGALFVLDISNNGNTLFMTNPNGAVVVLPALSKGQRTTFYQASNTGNITFVAGDGVTIRQSYGYLRTYGFGSPAVAEYRSATEVFLNGDLVP